MTAAHTASSVGTLSALAGGATIAFKAVARSRLTITNALVTALHVVVCAVVDQTLIAVQHIGELLTGA